MSIFIPNRGCHNVYHFLVYMVSNLRHVDFVPENIYIDLSNEYFSKNHNFVTEILEIIYPNVNVINKSFCPENCLTIKQDDIGIEVYKENTNVYNYLYKTFITHIKKYIENNNISSKYSKRIFISRNDSLYRNIINENEFYDKLQSLGFQRLVMTNIPLIEQMAIFHNAEIIIATHGAALVNTIFCKPRTKIIEINNETTKQMLHFSNISEKMNLHFLKYMNTTTYFFHDGMASNIFINDMNDFTEEIVSISSC